MPAYAVTVLAHINTTIVVTTDGDEDTACDMARIIVSRRILEHFPLDDLAAIEAVEVALHAGTDA